MIKIEWVKTDAVRPNPRNAKVHSRKQLRQIADSIKTFGFVVPIVVDEAMTCLAGAGRLDAAKMEGLSEVPVIRVDGLSDAKKRAFMLADNKIGQNGGWDRKKLAQELPELSELLIAEELDISVTGFAAVELDQLVVDFEENASDPADDIDAQSLDGPPVSKQGDVWHLDPHRLLCGDARDDNAMYAVLDEERAQMAFLDPPYNVRVSGVVGRGATKHAEFAMASGEMTGPQYVAFLKKAFDVASAMSHERALHYICGDWRHISELFDAARATYRDVINLAVWVKSNAGMGSFYRSEHELIAVCHVGDEPYLNNVELGRHARNRTNVWHYPGVSGFRAGRMDDLKAHPTVKPTQLVCDAIKDCTRRNDVVLDTFCGSGTTILAAERTGRRAFGVEIEPRYVDVAIRRWQAFTGKDAIHAASGACFDELAAHREPSQASSRRAK